MKFLVVIPAYNEAKTITRTIRDVLSIKGDLSILVVDDSSPDGTKAIVQEEFGAEPRVCLLYTSPSPRDS